MIKAENVNYVYENSAGRQNRALFDVSLEIPDGSLNAIIGHTGSGKSTLIQHFNGLIKPTSGKITVNGCDITDKKTDLTMLRKKVGLVFQYPEYQLFEETVEKDIAFGPKNLGLGDTEISDRVRRAAELVGLNERHLKKSPFELSGGEKRRAAIAGVLAMESEVLILDEPTAGLDPKGSDMILDIIKSLHKKNPAMIIIFVSHSMEDVAKTAENVYVMNNGRIAFSGTVEEVFKKSSELVKMGLNIPQITQFMISLKKCGYNVDDDIFTVDDAARHLTDFIKTQKS